MDLEVVRIIPTVRPIQDRIKIINDIIYAKGDFNLINIIENNHLQHLELEENIVALHMKHLKSDEGKQWVEFPYILQKNITINGCITYGDVLILGYYNGKYMSLSLEQIDKYIQLFK